MVASWPIMFETSSSNQGERQKDGEKRHRRRVSKGGYTLSEQQSQLARSPLGLGVVVATSLYCGVKAGIQVSPGLQLLLAGLAADCCQSAAVGLLLTDSHAPTYQSGYSVWHICTCCIGINAFQWGYVND